MVGLYVWGFVGCVTLAVYLLVVLSKAGCGCWCFDGFYLLSLEELGLYRFGIRYGWIMEKSGFRVAGRLLLDGVLSGHL